MEFYEKEDDQFRSQLSCTSTSLKTTVCFGV